MCDELHVRVEAAAGLLDLATLSVRTAFEKTRAYANTIAAVAIPQPTGQAGLDLWNEIAPEVQCLLASTQELCTELDALGGLGRGRALDEELATIVEFLRADMQRFCHRVGSGALDDAWLLTANVEALARGCHSAVTGLLSLFVRATHGRHAPAVAQFLAADLRRRAETVRQLRGLTDLVQELEQNPQAHPAQTTATLEDALAAFVAAGALHTMPLEMRRDFIAFRLNLLQVDGPSTLRPALEGFLRFLEVLTHQVAKGQSW
ncbi:MAG: hypothetical protein RIT81_32730 [Deltaproteobacteria bacterium]